MATKKEIKKLNKIIDDYCDNLILRKKSEIMHSRTCITPMYYKKGIDKYYIYEL